MNRKILNIFIIVLCCCISQITSNLSAASTALEPQKQLASEQNTSNPIGGLLLLFRDFLK